MGNSSDGVYLRNLKKIAEKLGQDKTVLHIAADQGDLHAVEKILERGINIDVEDNRGQTPLETAVTGWISLDRSLAHSKDNPQEVDSLIQGRKEVAEMLIQAGAKVDTKKFLGNTLLVYAVGHSHLEAVDLLLDAGADVNARDEYGSTPLHLSIVSQSSIDDRGMVARKLITEGANVDAKNENGICPLHFAAQEGFLSVAEFLVENGATVNAKTCDGVTPLTVARIEDQYEMISFLKRAGDEA